MCLKLHAGRARTVDRVSPSGRTSARAVDRLSPSGRTFVRAVDRVHPLGRTSAWGGRTSDITRVFLTSIFISRLLRRVVFTLWGVRPCGATRVTLSFLDVDVVLFTGELRSGRSTVGSPAYFWPLGKLNTWVYGGGSTPLGGRTGTPPVSFCSWILHCLDQTWMWLTLFDWTLTKLWPWRLGP